jgi:hypothetical protein
MLRLCRASPVDHLLPLRGRQFVLSHLSGMRSQRSSVAAHTHCRGRGPAVRPTWTAITAHRLRADTQFRAPSAGDCDPPFSGCRCRDHPGSRSRRRARLLPRRPRTRTAMAERRGGPSWPRSRAEHSPPNWWRRIAGVRGHPGVVVLGRVKWGVIRGVWVRVWVWLLVVSSGWGGGLGPRSRRFRVSR